MYKHILMPTDGSELSKAAVQQGVRLAKESDAKVTFLNVTMPFHVIATDSGMVTDTRSDYEKHSRERAEHILGECAEAARSAGVRCDTRYVANEHPYEAIVKAAEEADLVVMASHGRKGVKGLLLGSRR